MRISDWSSDVCSSDLGECQQRAWPHAHTEQTITHCHADTGCALCASGNGALVTPCAERRSEPLMVEQPMCEPWWRPRKAAKGENDEDRCWQQGHERAYRTYTHPNEPQHEPTGTRSPVQRLRRSVISQAPLHLLAPPLSRKFSGSAQPLRHRIGIVNERVSRSHRFPRKNEPVLVHVAVNFPRPIIHSRA